MFISTDVDIAAWSPDGGSALVSRAESGPEGGGRLAWVVVNAAGAATYTLSSTTSPGDGSTPETISAKQCRDAAAQLARRLASFDGVKVRTERCAGKRDAIVEVDAARQAQAQKSWIPEDTRVTGLPERGPTACQPPTDAAWIAACPSSGSAPTSSSGPNPCRASHASQASAIETTRRSTSAVRGLAFRNESRPCPSRTNTPSSDSAWKCRFRLRALPNRCSTVALPVFPSAAFARSR